MIALWGSGREDEADALSLEAFELARSRGNVTYTTWFAGTRIIVLFSEGAWDEATALGDSFLADAPASQGNPALSRCVLATIARDRGEPDRARAHLALVAPGVTSTTDRQQESLIDHREFVLADMEGRLDDLLGIAERWIDALLELGSDEAAAQVAGMTLDATADVEGKDATVSRLVETIDARSTSRRTPALEAELDRVKGTLASRQGDHDAAVEAFGRALGRSRATGRDRLLASVLAEYGAALLRAGRDDEAAPLLDEARALYERMGATVRLQRIEELQPRLPA